MNEKTKADYRKLAANFYDKRLAGEPPSPKRLADALKACADEYRPDYWRRLRNAIEFDQREKGFKAAAERVAATKNPTTTDSKGKPLAAAERRVKPKRRAIRSINLDDQKKLVEAVSEARDMELAAALQVAYHLGCRPAEMPNIEDHGDGRFTVHGVKKTGNRGADRTLVADESVRASLSKSIEVLRGANVGAIQDRLGRLTERLWPRRKARPTLKSFRHQMGANLKASGLDREGIAYTMGHQSTESVERYGDPRAAKGSAGLKVKADPEGLAASSIRQNHKEFGEPRNPAPAASLEDFVAREAENWDLPEATKEFNEPEGPAPERSSSDYGL